MERENIDPTSTQSSLKRSNSMNFPKIEGVKEVKPEDFEYYDIIGHGATGRIRACKCICNIEPFGDSFWAVKIISKYFLVK